jgi:thiamine-phosphate pyrophosphorylase
MIPPFYPILDTETVLRRGMALRTAAEALLEGGAEILQIRHKKHVSRSLFGDMEAIAEMCSRAGCLFVVNDRADLAVLLDAACHVGQDDLPPSEVRRLVGPAHLIGYSTHNQEQLRAALNEPADYLALGPIFSTTSKENPDPVVGLEGLREARQFTAEPLVAIGGITRANARAVLESGADSVAVISDIFPEKPDYQSLCERTREWLQLTNA